MTVMAYTSFTFAYLTRAAVLAETLRAAHPDWMLWALVADIPPVDIGPDSVAAALLQRFDHVVYAHTLGLPRFRAWIFKHDVVEACTAVKGRMLRHLLAAGADQVLYFDPDIAVFHPMPQILERLRHDAVVLTPHQLDANEEPAAIADNELGSLRYGIYNLGFLGVRNDPEGRRFAGWWDDMLLSACYDEPERGLFTDQKYCDAVPGLFERVHVLRDPGCNVASWNISRRHLAVTPEGDLTVNGESLKFYHFTKIFGVGDTMTERYAGSDPTVFELVAWYRAEVSRLDADLAAAGMTDLPWHYGRFTDGQPIPKPVRRFYRERTDLIGYFADPFAVNGNCLRAWIARERPDLLAA